VTQPTLDVLHSALSGLALRQRIIADNIANVETPHFLAGRVDFESALRDAMADGDGSMAEPTVARSLEPTRTNGNNVNLDQETLALIDTGLRYQMIAQAVSGKFQLLRTALQR
jgi:flagellar basal-body rod protein FlgB